ncbi:arginase [Geothermobacter hydrogeniphilus]|uniref:Arginase n=1 Tax=Geothermobacter hydrogeniphilus TaxID=1969733 RepID=A0A1X0XSH9_9BACT|nr:arginase [Geothermobacter hydrogeniphilus]ORJ55855.1 arginase [Geothermobacter hydrogeniphilus]
MTKRRKVQIIGVPMDLGQDQRGVDLGPGALRYAGLAAKLRRLDLQVDDAGNLPIPVRDALDPSRPERFRNAILQVCETLYRVVARAVMDGYIPLILGGDHSLAIGSVGGASDAASTGLLWIDAHGDFNTPRSSPSGNIHGMPLATLLGEGDPGLVNVGRKGAKLRGEDVVLLGIRDLDDEEKERVRASGICVLTMRDIDQRGMGAVMEEALERLSGHARLHVSLDVDAVDPREAPGVGTPVPGGLSYREAQLVMEMVADSGRLAALDIVEINPILDHRNQTAQLAVALAASLFGQRIL